MSITRSFRDKPILCWTIDSFEQFNDAIQEVNPSFDLNEYIERYRSNVYEPSIDILFNGASIKLNLGGENEKVKIITTEKPTGIFDFSLAAKGLYRVQEYYSETLAREYPDKFKGYQLESGLVPPNLVKDKLINGSKSFYYEDSDGFFNLTKQQKGTTAIKDGVIGAKLKYATKTKKVYLNYKRKGGKVKYAEIYSLFYYSTNADNSLSGDIEFAIRHIPAIMVAEYLESMGIMTRVYMTRFVELNDVNYELKEFDENGNKLPMFDLLNASQNNNFRSNLFVQPIIVKEFGQELDKSFAFMVSSAFYDRVYEIMARFAQQKEVESDIQLYGRPVFDQDQYFVGIERYRNKYKQYVDLGIFKSKEVLPEAMLFFHDESIALYLHQFNRRIGRISNNPNISELLSNNIVSPFFSWWMRLSANVLKDKINIINSNELQKDLVLIRSDLDKLIADYQEVIANTSDRSYKNVFTEYGQNILRQFSIYDNAGNITFRRYIEKITNEITTYADGAIYETDEESKEKRDQLATDVFSAISSIS